ncbi:hypothetical protein [Heliorestis acidaminivorans]|nr:hypothetical protein [Heliorestis acidaminivorans]
MQIIAPLFAGWAVAYAWIFPKTIFFGALFYYLTVAIEKSIEGQRDK